LYQYFSKIIWQWTLTVRLLINSLSSSNTTTFRCWIRKEKKLKNIFSDSGIEDKGVINKAREKGFI
jgi:hypothetical protein